MNYTKITTNDIANGNGIRVVLWVSGCEHFCSQCHNPQTWDKNSGKPFTPKQLEYVINELKNDYISGITYSGGDPLFPDNRNVITKVAQLIKYTLPKNRTQWLYTGYKWEEIKDLEILNYIDVLVDGKFEINNKDISLKFRGSTNQRLIDVQKSLKENKVILWQ